MRPVLLRMKAFGSYGEETEIDFRKIAEPLFLITGDTGAGKTTVFDAMVFALYGRSAAADGKEGSDLKSHFVEDEPTVTFRFLTNNKEYEITRSPRYSRMKKRGAGEILVSEKLSLLMPDGTEFLGKVKETNEKIEEIIGLTKAQFMQVAMIAQGEFMALLRAKSDEKKEIFRKLFNTGRFEKIVNALDERKKELRREFERAEESCKADIKRINIANEKIMSLKRDILNDARIDIAKTEEFLHLTGESIGEAKEEKANLSVAVESLKSQRDALRDNLKSAEELKRDFDRLRAEEAAFKEFIKDEADIEADKKLAVEIEKAYEIKERFERYEKARVKVDELKAGLQENEKRLPVIKKEFDDKTEILNKSEEPIKTEIAKLQATIQNANEAVALFVKIEEVGKALAAAKAALSDDESAEEKLNGELGRLKIELEEKKAELDTLSSTDAKREKLNGEYTALYDFGKSAQEFKALENEYKVAKAGLQRAQGEYAAKRELLKEREEEYSLKERLFFDSQAGVLAKTLKDGVPCPVCGSLEHPAPAKVTGETVKKEELDALQENVKKSREVMQGAAIAANELNAALKEKEKHFKNKSDSVKDEISRLTPLLNSSVQEGCETKSLTGLEFEEPTVEFLRETYKLLRDALAQKEAALKAEEERFKVLGDFIRTGEKKRVLLEKKRDDLERRRRESINRVSLLEGEYGALAGSKKFDTVKDAKDALKTAEAAKNAAEDKLKKARIERDAAKSRLERVETLIGQYKENIPREEREAQTALADYSAAKDKHDLSDEEWQRLVDYHRKEESELLKSRAEKFEREKAVKADRIATLTERTADKPPPDIEEMRTALTAAEEKLRDTENKLLEIHEHFFVNNEAFISLKNEMSSRKKVLAVYETHENLYKKLSGKIAGGYLDIETFVQRYYLEEILQLANRRLLAMTGEEYELRLLDAAGAEEKRNRGLDLMVYSYITGKIREMRTLSGGESFLAALSLALGMADRIEARASAISPDILFIDEGFGSLDDNARREAVRVLKKVAGSHRLIAIISHVTELRREMETKLLVTKTPRGSFAKWES